MLCRSTPGFRIIFSGIPHSRARLLARWSGQVAQVNISVRDFGLRAVRPTYETTRFGRFGWSGWIIR